MNYKIFKDGAEINTIFADESFVISYCERHGYTFEKLPEPAPEPEPETEEDMWAELDAAYTEGYREGVDSV